MPIDETMRIEKKEGKTFPPLPKDIYTSELLDISIQERPTYDTRLKPDSEKVFEKVFSFQFTLLEGRDGENELRGRNVWANFVPTYLYIGKNGKNDLYRIVEALHGQELSPAEEAEGLTGSMLNSLIGKQCRISVEPKKSKDGSKTFDQIVDYLKANSQQTPLTAEEKEKARIKDKDEQPQQEEQVEINVENIPFGN
jgi:hypothetical protein